MWAVLDTYHVPSSKTTVLEAQFHRSPIMLIQAICSHSRVPCLGKKRVPESQSFPRLLSDLVPTAVPGGLPEHLLVMVAHGHGRVRAQQGLVLFPAAGHGLQDGLV